MSNIYNCSNRIEISLQWTDDVREAFETPASGAIRAVVVVEPSHRSNEVFGRAALEGCPVLLGQLLEETGERLIERSICYLRGATGT
jgi:hypothetical protein